MIPTATTKSHFAGALGHTAQLQAVLLLHDWLWAASAMHTGLIPLLPVLSRDAPEMEPGCLNRISQGCRASTAFQALCSLPQLLRKTAPHYVGSCMDTRSLFFPTAPKKAEDPP